MSNSTDAVNFGLQLRKSSIKYRIIKYTMMFVFVLLIWTIITATTDMDSYAGNIFNKNSTGFLISKSILYFIPPLIPFILIELSVRKERKKLGYPINADISDLVAKDELKRKMEFEDSVRSEVSSDSNKDDISYWFELKEKGAISEEEYQKKKEELLSK